jgi:acetoacetyl-CoA reductase
MQEAAIALVGKDIDILINNAGRQSFGYHSSIPQDFGLMTLMPAMLSDIVRRRMSIKGWGRIVNIGSVNGQGGQIGQVNYAAAKSGIHGFTKSLAAEGARHGVTANAIAPGYIGTEMLSTIPENVMEKIVAQIPVGRLGQPEEIARGVEFLTSDNAGFITGSTLSINGGQHMY